MRLLIAAVLTLAASTAPAANYFECVAKDYKTRWTSTPCNADEKQTEYDGQTKKPVANAQQAADDSLYEKYKVWCKEIGYNSSYSSTTTCAGEQMDGLRYLRKVKADFAEGSVQHQRLQECVGRYYSKVTELLDARMAKVCYLQP